MPAVNKKRTVPYTSPRRASNHYRRNRNKLLRELGLSAHLTGSQFGIIWVPPVGDAEVYASEALQPLLQTFFPADALEEAKAAAARVAARKALDRDDDPSRRIPPDVYGPTGEAFDPAQTEQQDALEDDFDSEDDEMLGTQQGAAGPKAVDRRRVTATPRPASAASNSADTTSASVLQPPTPSRPQHHSTAPTESPTSPPSAPARITRSLTHLSADPRLSPSLSPAAYVPRTFNPTTLAAWYAAKFSALPQKVCKTVAKLWIRVVEPEKQTKWPYIAGEPGAPAWWPKGVRHREPDHLVKAERLVLLDALIHVSEVPISHYERATGSTALIPHKQAPLLDEIYKCAREERRAVQASGGSSFEWITVLLPEPAPVDETRSPKSESGTGRHRSRRSITAIPSDNDAGPRARPSTDPYPLSRSASVSDVHVLGSTAPARPLSRSHSLSGHISGAASRDQVSGTAGRASRKGPMSLGGVSEQGEYGAFSDVGSSMAQFGLQPALSQQQQEDLIGRPMSVNDPRRPSKQEQQSYQLHDGPSPSSGRMQTSPTGSALGRSHSTSSIEPSFASPAMIKSRSHLSHQHLGSIAEGAGGTNEFGQRSTSGGSAGGRLRPSVLVPVHAAHELDLHQQDYPTPTYPHPPPNQLYHSQSPAHQSRYEPPPPPLQPMQPLRPSPVLFQASTFGASLVDAPTSASSYYDHQPLQEHYHDPYGPSYVHHAPHSHSLHQHQQNASLHYWTPESLDGTGADGQGMSYIHQPSEYDYNQQHQPIQHSGYAMDLGVTGLGVGGEMADMYEMEEERVREETQRRYQEHAYGVQG